LTVGRGSRVDGDGRSEDVFAVRKSGSESRGGGGGDGDGGDGDGGGGGGGALSPARIADTVHTYTQKRARVRGAGGSSQASQPSQPAAAAAAAAAQCRLRCLLIRPV